MTTYPAESFYRATIRQSILSTTSVPFTLKVSKIPTLTSWLLTLSPNTANEEIIEYSAVDWTALTITVSKRGIDPASQALTTDTVDYNDVAFMRSHSQNDAIRWDVNHLHIAQIDWYFNLSENETTTWNNTHSWAEVFTKSIKVPSYADATARDAGIPSPANGMLIYNTALWILQQYIAWAWAAFASGTTPNADTTTAGKVEIATLAESDWWVAIWWTWASLVITPDKLAYFGDWSDWNVTISTNTTLTSDKYYNNLTVNTGITLDPAWYIIYVAWTLTLTGTAKIIRNGNNATNAAWAVQGTWWAALATWTCWVCLGWYDWQVWGAFITNVAWIAWVATTNSYATTGTNSAAWVEWGGTSLLKWASASATQWLLYNKVLSITKLIAFFNSPQRAGSITQYTWLPSSWQSIAWASSSNAVAWASWWVWGNGWLIFIYANIIAGSWTIEAKWGNWWNWGNATAWAWPAGGGGWGSWWQWGIVFLVYHTWTPYAITLTWGTWGTWWAWASWWAAGTAGNSGTIWQSITINK